MKTKIRTLVVICILGFIGAINVTAANYRNADNKVVVEEGKVMKNELGNVDRTLVVSTENTLLESDANVETAQFLLNEDPDAEIDLQKEAQLVSKWIADREEAKVFKKLLDEGKVNKLEAVQSLLNEGLDAKTDVEKEDQLVTKWIADQEEARVVRKLIAEGKLGEIN